MGPGLQEEVQSTGTEYGLLEHTDTTERHQMGPAGGTKNFQACAVPLSHALPLKNPLKQVTYAVPQATNSLLVLPLRGIPQVPPTPGLIQLQVSPASYTLLERKAR